MKRILTLLFLPLSSLAWTVSVGTWVCNPDASVAVPVAIDDAAGLAYMAVRVNYDPQVLVCLGIEKGDLAGSFDGDFLSSDDEAGSLSFARFRASDGVAGSGGGVLARLVFAVRPGTARPDSDLAVADVRLGDDTGVRDLALEAPVAPEGGMVRVFPENGAAARLEGAQTVVADTRRRLAHEPRRDGLHRQRRRLSRSRDERGGPARRRSRPRAGGLLPRRGRPGRFRGIGLQDAGGAAVSGRTA